MKKTFEKNEKKYCTVFFIYDTLNIERKEKELEKMKPYFELTEEEKKELDRVFCDCIRVFPDFEVSRGNTLVTVSYNDRIICQLPHIVTSKQIEDFSRKFKIIEKK